MIGQQSIGLVHQFHSQHCSHHAVVTDRISATTTVSAPKLRQKSVSAWFWFRLTEFRPSYGYGRNQHRVTAACRKCSTSVTFRPRQQCEEGTFLRITIVCLGLIINEWTLFEVERCYGSRNWTDNLKANSLKCDCTQYILFTRRYCSELK